MAMARQIPPEAASSSDDDEASIDEIARNESGSNSDGGEDAGGREVSVLEDSDKASAGPFRTEGKGAAIAKAFAKVTHGRTEDNSSGAAILSGSKSVLKRQREEATEEAVEHKAKVLRREMRKRGHSLIPRIGEDTSHDAREKQLLRTARKGVVRLYNAVSKAQKQVSGQPAGGGHTKGQLTKADFLAELRGRSGITAGSVGSDSNRRSHVTSASPSEPADVPSWAPLRDDDLSALSSGLKMKDWDKTNEQPGLIAETLADNAESDVD